MVFTFSVADSTKLSCVKSIVGNVFSHCVICLFIQLTAFEFHNNLSTGLISYAVMVFFRKSLAVPVSSSTFYIFLWQFWDSVSYAEVLNPFAAEFV